MPVPRDAPQVLRPQQPQGQAQPLAVLSRAAWPQRAQAQAQERERARA
jgi:hypothetical protein